MTTTVETPQTWTPLGRVAAAGTLAATGVLWTAASLLNKGTTASAYSLLTEVGITLDLLAVPFLFWTAMVWLLLSRRTSPRLAWTGAILLTCAVAGQGVISGVEVISYVVGTSGRIDISAYSEVIDSGSGLPMAAFTVMFMGGALGGILAMMIALWRSRTLPRAACALMVGFQILDFVGPDLPYTPIALVVFCWMALSIARSRPVAATP